MTYYLYVKTHNETGLKYLGQTSSDPSTKKEFFDNIKLQQEFAPR